MAFVHQCANGQRIATRVDGTLYYVHQDLLGSTVALSDADGGEAGRVQYDPYGEVLTSTLPVTLTDRLFTGARFDGTIGLYQMGARWYDPALGRWIQADSIVPNPTNHQDLNRYTYVRNNPLRYTDPSGHWIFEETPGDPWIWYSNKPVNTLIRTAEPVAFWEEFHQPTDAEFFAVVTSPFWASGLALGFETLAIGLWEAGAIACEAVIRWAIAHPLEALVGKAIAEEAFEATATGTPFDPANVALDILTQVGDEAMPRRRGNPYGSPGGPPHSSVVEEIKADIRARRLRPRTEYKVDLLGPGTEGKRFRRVDVAALDVNLDPVEFHQVGDMTRRVGPVARERRAIIDITEFSNYTHVPVYFWPKRYGD